MAEQVSEKKVLVADDDEAIRGLVVATLGGDDRYQTLQASNGEEALEVARREKPDLVFLDVLMPKMDGVEVCRQLKADGSNVSMKIIMLTAMAQQADKERAVQAGADDYFTKPFSPIALLLKVEEILAL